MPLLAGAWRRKECKKKEVPGQARNDRKLRVLVPSWHELFS
jgi:hypothetical protein